MSLKKTFYQTTYTEIPSHIPRQLAIDLLHNHNEIIELNPLVIGHSAIKAPSKAPADEYYSTWYDIQQRIQLIPGTGKVGASKISFHGVFHDLPNGLQTHIYAPGGIDLRHKYTINGNQPGEPPQIKELGSGAPTSGLYLKQEVEVRCNVMMISFVKKEQKSATAVLIARLVKKAELVDAGILHAMMDQGRLTTVNPANRSSTIPLPSPGLTSGFPQSPRSSHIPYQSPRLPTSENGSFGAELPGSQTGVRQSQYESQHDSQRGSQYGSHYGQPPPSGLGFELPADNTYPAQQQPGYSHHSGSQASDRGSYYEASANSTQHSQPSQSTDRSFVYEMSGESVPSQQHANMDARSYGSPTVQRSPSLQPNHPAGQPPYRNSPPGRPAYGNTSPHGVNHFQPNHPVEQSTNRNSAAGQPAYGNSPPLGMNQLQPHDTANQSPYRRPSVEQSPYQTPPPQGESHIHSQPVPTSRPEDPAPDDRPTQRYTGSTRIQQVARKSSWEPDDDKKEEGGRRD